MRLTSTEQDQVKKAREYTTTCVADETKSNIRNLLAIIDSLSNEPAPPQPLAESDATRLAEIRDAVKHDKRSRYHGTDIEGAWKTLWGDISLLLKLVDNPPLKPAQPKVGSCYTYDVGNPHHFDSLPRGERLASIRLYFANKYYNTNSYDTRLWVDLDWLLKQIEQLDKQSASTEAKKPDLVVFWYGGPNADEYLTVYSNGRLLSHRDCESSDSNKSWLSDVMEALGYSYTESDVALCDMPHYNTSTHKVEAPPMKLSDIQDYREARAIARQNRDKRKAQLQEELAKLQEEEQEDA